jgi:hypothetical protein
MKFCHVTLAAALALSPCLAHAHGDACAKPFQTSGSLAVPANYSGVTGQFTVPAGYRLQIEQVSGSIRLASTTDRADFQIGTTVGGTFGVHDLAVAEGYSVIDRKTYGVVTLYADKASIVSIYISRMGSSYPATSARWTVTGCLFPA